jgi:hypothetical protein
MKNTFLRNFTIIIYYIISKKYSTINPFFNYFYIEKYFISLKASWVSRLADSTFSNWKLIPLKYLNVFGKL